MARIFDHPRPDGRQFGDLVPLHLPHGPHLLDQLGESMTAVTALLRHYRLDLIDSFDGYQGPIRSAMAGLSARLPPLFFRQPRGVGLTRPSIAGGRFGRIGRLLFA